MLGKEAQAAATVRELDSTKFVDRSRAVYVEVPSQDAPAVDPIQSLQANIKTLKNLTSELSFMVKEIGQLTKK